MLLEVSQESLQGLQGNILQIPFNTIYACATTGTCQIYHPLLKTLHIQMDPVFNTYTNDGRLTVNSRAAYPHTV